MDYPEGDKRRNRVILNCRETINIIFISFHFKSYGSLFSSSVSEEKASKLLLLVPVNFPPILCGTEVCILGSLPMFTPNDEKSTSKTYVNTQASHKHTYG